MKLTIELMPDGSVTTEFEGGKVKEIDTKNFIINAVEAVGRLAKTHMDNNSELVEIREK